MTPSASLSSSMPTMASVDAASPALSRKPEDLVPDELRRFDLYDQPKVQESFVAQGED